MATEEVVEQTVQRMMEDQEQVRRTHRHWKRAVEVRNRKVIWLWNEGVSAARLARCLGMAQISLWELIRRVHPNDKPNKEANSANPPH